MFLRTQGAAIVFSTIYVAFMKKELKNSNRLFGVSLVGKTSSVTSRLKAFIEFKIAFTTTILLINFCREKKKLHVKSNTRFKCVNFWSGSFVGTTFPFLSDDSGGSWIYQVLSIFPTKNAIHIFHIKWRLHTQLMFCTVKTGLYRAHILLKLWFKMHIFFLKKHFTVQPIGIPSYKINWMNNCCN